MNRFEIRREAIHHAGVWSPTPPVERPPGLAAAGAAVHLELDDRAGATIQAILEGTVDRADAPAAHWRTIGQCTLAVGVDFAWFTAHSAVDLWPYRFLRLRLANNGGTPADGRAILLLDGDVDP